MISRAPALVMPYSWRRTHTVTDDEELAYLAKDRDSWAAGEALVRDPGFKKLYAPYDFILDSGDHLMLWRRKDFTLAEASDPARANLDGSRQ